MFVMSGVLRRLGGLPAVVVVALLVSQSLPERVHSVEAAPRRGVVNALLKAQVRQALRRHAGLHAERAALLPVIITSTRDEAAAVRAAGGTVDADIRGRVLAARLPASAVAGLARTPGVRAIYPSLK